MKRFFVRVSILAAAATLFAVGYAQAAGPVVWGDSAWRFSGNASLTFSQVALSNWVAGGQNSLSGEAGLFLALDYAKGRNAWNTTLDMGYGLTQLGDEGLVKHLDKFEFASKYGYQAYKAWYYSALFSLKSQFAPGYKYPDRQHVISDFLSPLYGVLALGADYKPDDHFSLMLSPLTGRMVYVRNQELADAGAFGVKKAEWNPDGTLKLHGENVLWEFGGFVKAEYRNVYLDGLLGLNTKLELFSNYLNKPKNVDVNYDLMLDYHFTSALTMKFQLTLIYDDDMKIKQDNGHMSPKLQVREMFGVGLAYRF